MLLLYLINLATITNSNNLCDKFLGFFEDNILLVKNSYFVSAFAILLPFFPSFSVLPKSSRTCQVSFPLGFDFPFKYSHLVVTGAHSAVMESLPSKVILSSI